jgi:hypothetical protein
VHAIRRITLHPRQLNGKKRSPGSRPLRQSSRQHTPAKPAQTKPLGPALSVFLLSSLSSNSTSFFFLSSFFELEKPQSRLQLSNSLTRSIRHSFNPDDLIPPAHPSHHHHYHHTACIDRICPLHDNFTTDSSLVCRTLIIFLALQTVPS